MKFRLRHYDVMYSKTPMSGDMNFGGSQNMYATAVGNGYLKQPLRYLTSDDIKTMGNRTMHIPKPTTSQSQFALERQFNSTFNSTTRIGKVQKIYSYSNHWV